MKDEDSEMERPYILLRRMVRLEFQINQRKSAVRRRTESNDEDRSRLEGIAMLVAFPGLMAWRAVALSRSLLTQWICQCFGTRYSTIREKVEPPQLGIVSSTRSPREHRISLADRAWKYDDDMYSRQHSQSKQSDP